MPRRADPALPERRRAQILAAARVCFAERGFRHTTVEDICVEAQVSPGALYRYFAAKADLVAAVALEVRAEADTAFAALDGAENLIAALAEAARLYFERVQAQAALMAEIWAEAARDRELERLLAEQSRATAGRLAGAIQAGQRRGEIYPALAGEEAAALLLAALEGLALREAAAHPVGRFRVLALHLLKPKR